MNERDVFTEGNLVVARDYPALGVGRVSWVNTTSRTATVEFDDLAQIMKWSDLEHKVYPPGERVYSKSEQMFGRVHHSIYRDGLYFYLIDFPFGRRGKDETDVEERRSEDPIDRLSEGLGLDPPLDFDLRTQAMRLKLAYKYDDRVYLSNVRIELSYPHQIFVAHRVVQTYKPRFILSDEVGLGKTIEAGLILKELRARGLVHRILITVPANLVNQWETELRKKFNERFTIYDGPTVRFLQREHPDKNVWTLRESVICSLPFARHPNRRVEIASASWDLVIIDEAHHVRRYLESDGSHRATHAYHLAEELQDNTQGFLLLTATPMQLHPFELFSLIEILDPVLFPTYEDFEQHRSSEVKSINEVISNLRQFDSLSVPVKIELAKNLQRMIRLQSSGPHRRLEDLLSELDRTEYRDQIIDELERSHRLSRVLIRNRKKVVGGFTEREPKTVLVELTEEERQAYERVTDWVRSEYREAVAADNHAVGFAMVIFQQLLTSSRHALMRSLERRMEKLRDKYLEKVEEELLPEIATVDVGDLEDIGEEDELMGAGAKSYVHEAVLEESDSAVRREIETVRELHDRLASIETDSKLAQLLQALKEIFGRHESEKVLIFTRFLDTQEYLQTRLSQEYKVVTFSGGMKPEEKDRAVDQFAGSAQIMISTEAGGEGRNLQFCHIMFNYDLPWNPMRIEQRIGRIDRIGQKKKVYIYNFSVSGTIEERILNVLQRRIRLFEETVGGLDPILGEFERDLRRIIMLHGDDFAKEFEKFELSLEQKIRKAREMEAKIADFVMDTRSYHKETVDRILGRQPPVTWQDLQEFVERFITRYPAGSVQAREGDVVKFEVPEAFRRFYSELSSSYVGTFNPARAIAQEGLDFFAFGHPLIDSVVEFCTSQRFGGTATQREVGGHAGAPFLGLQVNYVARFRGIKPVEKLYCLVFDESGNHQSEVSEVVLGSWTLPESPGNIPGEMGDFSLGSVYERSERVLLELLTAEQAQLQEESQEIFERESRKLKAVYELRIRKVEERKSSDQQLLARLRASPAESERRIIPAIEGRIAGFEKELAELERNHRAELEALEHRKLVSFDFELIGAALVELRDGMTSR